MLLITCQNLFELYTLCIISIQYMQEPICFCGGLVIWGQQNSKFVCCGNRIKVRLNEVWGEKTVCFACGRVKVKFKYLICGLSCVQSETWRVSDLIFRSGPDWIYHSYIDKSFSTSSQDDKAAMDFVTCTANLRSHIFLIPQKSRFDVKCKLCDFTMF